MVIQLWSIGEYSSFTARCQVLILKMAYFSLSTHPKLAIHSHFPYRPGSIRRRSPLEEGRMFVLIGE